MAALDGGVDDILTEPVIAEELRAHIRAMVRRTHGSNQAVCTIRVGDLELNLVERCVRSGGISIHLTSLEQAILYLLAVSPGMLISRAAMLDALWGEESAPGNNALERHVSRLQGKLRSTFSVAYRIETVRGAGYRLTPPPMCGTSPTESVRSVSAARRVSVLRHYRER